MIRKIFIIALLLWVPSSNILAASPRDIKIIKGIRIEGLRNVILDQLPHISTFSTKKDKRLDYSALQDDVQRIFLTGYFSSVNPILREEEYGTIVVFSVTENTVIQEIKFEGLSQFSDSHMKRLLKNKENSVLNVAKIPSDISAIESIFHRRGMELFRVNRMGMDESGTLTMSLSEGRVRSVTLKGLKTVKPFVVSRELRQKKGTVFNSRILRKDRTRLLKLGYFSSVSIPKLSPGPEKDDVDIAYQLTEKKSNHLDLGLEQLRRENGIAAFFQIYYHHALMYSDVVSAKTQVLLSGDDQTLSVRSYSLRYYQPWLMNVTPTSFAFDIWTEFRENRGLNSVTSQ